MGWAYLVLEPLLFRGESTGLVCHFAGGNTEPEGGARRPCVGRTTPTCSLCPSGSPCCRQSQRPQLLVWMPRDGSPLARCWPTWQPLGPPQSRARLLGSSLGGGLWVTVGSRLVPSLHLSGSPFTNGHNLPCYVTERVGLDEFAKSLAQSVAQSWPAIHIC